MGNIVILSLGKGSLNAGFSSVTALLWLNSNPHPIKFTGSLPPAPEIPELYRNWRLLYVALSQRLQRRGKIEIEDGGVTNISQVDLNSVCDRFHYCINNWLNSEDFRQINHQIRTELSRSDQIRVIIETDDDLLRRIPWHLWNFFEDYPQAEIALSTQEWQIKNNLKTTTDQVKILAILGNSEGINIQADQNFLQTLPGAKVKFLVEPKRQQLNESLWEQGWDIFFFAGHSKTEAQTGRIYLNETDSLTIEQLKFALKTAIERGLKLAIFNSCDGLGLAEQLASLHIPQVIIMREPVPDRVAQQFLKYFLNEYASGESLYLSVRRARERLQGLEEEFPCASWLPVIFQNPAQLPLTWQEMSSNQQKQVIKPQKKQLPGLVKVLTMPVFIASILTLVLVLGIRQLGWLQSWELQAYDQLMRLKPDEGKDHRILVLKITESDLKYQAKLGMKRDHSSSLSDSALEQILSKFQPLKPRAIALTIYHDFPFSIEQNLATKVKNNPNFFAMCRGGDPSPTSKHPGISPPDNFSENRVGFSDVIADKKNNNILRRYLWAANFNNDSPCQAEKSISLKLGLHYLKAENIYPQFTQEGYLVGKALLKPLNFPAGGYQKLDGKEGYQMLLNYRSRNIAEEVTLTQVLQNQFNPDLVKNRIILIGVTAESINDNYYTPYSDEQIIRSVFLQAQMVSQILSAALDGRPLLEVLPAWGDAVWILVWCLTGGVLVGNIRQIIPLVLAGGIAIAILYGICFIVFWKQAIWIPLVPSGFGLILTGITVEIYAKYHTQKLLIN